MSPNQRCSPYGLLPSGLDHHTQPTGWRRRCCEWRWEGGSPARGMEPWEKSGVSGRWAARSVGATVQKGRSNMDNGRVRLEPLPHLHSGSIYGGEKSRHLYDRKSCWLATKPRSWITTGINFVVARCSSHWTENERWSDDHILLVVAKLRSLIRLPLVVIIAGDKMRVVFLYTILQS